MAKVTKNRSNPLGLEPGMAYADVPLTDARPDFIGPGFDPDSAEYEEARRQTYAALEEHAAAVGRLSVRR